jgi:hypothetical protein
MTAASRVPPNQSSGRFTVGQVLSQNITQTFTKKRLGGEYGINQLLIFWLSCLQETHNSLLERCRILIRG